MIDTEYQHPLMRAYWTQLDTRFAQVEEVFEDCMAEALSVFREGIVQANGQMMVEPRMDVQDVADAIVFMAGLSLDSNVQFMTIMATKMPFVGRG